jgi:hypothetical protein
VWTRRGRFASTKTTIIAESGELTVNIGVQIQMPYSCAWDAQNKCAYEPIWYFHVLTPFRSHIHPEFISPTRFRRGPPPSPNASPCSSVYSHVYSINSSINPSKPTNSFVHANSPTITTVPRTQGCPPTEPILSPQSTILHDHRLWRGRLMASKGTT